MKKLPPFINLQSDYGFKRAFGTVRFQSALIRLLNIVLEGKVKVTRVEFRNKEILPPEKDGKRIVYDVYFTTPVPPGKSFYKEQHILKDEKEKDVEHHFILEMQNVYEPPFEDRIFYYSAKVLAEQGKSGWNYDLDPLVTIAITDFHFPHLSPGFEREFMLRDERGNVLTNKFSLITLSLKSLPKTWKECKTEKEKALYLIKYMDKMDKNSEPYQSKEYEEFFDAADSLSMVEEDYVPYSQSVERLHSYQRGIDFACEQGRREGIIEGRREGILEGRREGILEGRREGILEGRREGIIEGRREGILEGKQEGRMEEKEEMALKMILCGFADSVIINVTGLSESEILNLKKNGISKR